MLTIWKYPLEIMGEQTISISEHNQPLDIQMQNGQPCLWAVVDTDADQVERKVYIVGTGQDVNPIKHVRAYYVGTVQEGRWVWHVFIQRRTCSPLD